MIQFLSLEIEYMVPHILFFTKIKKISELHVTSLLQAFEFQMLTKSVKMMTCELFCRHNIGSAINVSFIIIYDD